jgi:ribosomal protein S18 acetylase RimI-like enzyme
VFKVDIFLIIFNFYLAQFFGKLTKEYHGKSVGQLLYDQAIKIARQKNADYVWLGVWEENPRAINFYKKNGFVEFDKHIFKLGNDEQTDIMMKLKLNDNE